jgi:hypothetical protein
MIRVVLALSPALVAAGCDPRTRVVLDDGYPPYTAADFITQLVFASDSGSFTYDAATGTTTHVGDAGSP